MHRGIALLLSLALTFVAAPAQAASAGATCSKVGAKATQGKVVLVCKKNAKGKAVWTKVSITTPVASPTSTPPKTLDTWEVTQQILDFKWASKTSVASPIQIEYQSQSALPKWATDAISYLQPSLDFFDALGVPVKHPTQLVVGEFSYVSVKTRELGCRTIGSEEVSDNCAPGVLFLNLTPTPLMHNKESVLIHELFHQAQTEAAESVGRNRYYFPLWLRQGGAEVMRNYVYGKVSGLGYKYMREFQISHRESNCEAFTLRSNIAQGRMTNAPRTCDYTGGFLVVERLIAQSKETKVLVSWALRSDLPMALEDGAGNLPALKIESYLAAIEPVFQTPNGLFESEMETYVRKAIFG